MPYAFNEGTDQLAFEETTFRYTQMELNQKRYFFPTVHVAEHTNTQYKYRNDPDLSDRQIMANSIDPAQTGAI